MDYKEYNRLRYARDPRKSFKTTLRSHARILERCGYQVTPPPADQLEDAVTAYLATRTKRERIV